MSKISISPLRFSHIAGILCVVTAMTIFMTQDMAIKWLSGDYPLHEVILIRSAVAAIIILAVFLPLEGGLSIIRTNKLTAHLLRGFGIVVANLALWVLPVCHWRKPHRYFLCLRCLSQFSRRCFWESMSVFAGGSL